MTKIKLKKPVDFRKYNEGKWKKRPPEKRLPENIQVMVSTEALNGIQRLINKGRFPNTSELVRHLIISYLDEVNGW